MFYWLDKIKPTKQWQPNSINEFTWPTGAVLRQLDQRLNIYELGALIRLKKETPGSVEEVAPAILYHTKPPEKIGGYLFTMKTNGDARISCKILRGWNGGSANEPIVQENTGWPAIHRAKGCGGAQEARHKSVCKGYFLERISP